MFRFINLDQRCQHIKAIAVRGIAFRAQSRSTSRQFQRCERDIGISVETMALFVRSWLISTPALSDASQAASRAKGLERCEGFVGAVGRRIAKGNPLLRELSEDRAADASQKPEENAPARSAPPDRYDLS